LKKNAWNIVFTSGTLQPFAGYSTKTSVNVDFPVTFTCGHVINPKRQLSMHLVSRLRYLDSEVKYDYNNRNNENLKHHTGVLLGNYSRIVPQGMVVFFSSYFVMKTYIEKWQTHGKGIIWKILSEHKYIAIETKDKKDFQKSWLEFSHACKVKAPPKGQGSAPIKNNPTNGGIFFAVAGAKLSEGIDFSDGMARLVIMVGIPFKSTKSMRTEQKMKYLDRVIVEMNAKNNPLYQDGWGWYNTQAHRNIN
jgi:Rad3-related DNA helicase